MHSQTGIKKAAVIIPPIRDFYFTPHRFSSIGATILYNLLEKRGVSTAFFNFPLQKKKPHTIELPAELSYLKPFIIDGETGKTSFFTSFKHFGPQPDICARTIAEYKPDICFISCFAFCYSLDTLKLAQLIKINLPSVLIVLGGAGVSAFPAYFLKDTSVDYTLSGEAEVSLDNLLQLIRNPLMNPQTIPNLGWKQNGKPQISSIAKLTRPQDIETAIVKTTENKCSISFSVHLSRGCPMKCNFCSNWLCHGKVFRRPGLEQLKEAVEKIRLDTGNKVVSINFEDDNLLLDYDFWVDCIYQFKQRFPQALFYAENGIDYRLLSPSRCRELIKLGMVQFNFSLGSVNTNVLGNSNRQSDSLHFDKILSITSNAAIPVISYIICGFEDETLTSIVENLHYIFQRNTQLGLSLFYAVPGITGFENRLLFENLSPTLCAGSSAYPWNRSLSTKTLVTTFRLARFINLMKHKQKSNAENDLISQVIKSKKLFTFQKSGLNVNMIEVPEQDIELVKMFVDKIRSTSMS